MHFAFIPENHLCSSTGLSFAMRNDSLHKREIIATFGANTQYNGRH